MYTISEIQEIINLEIKKETLRLSKSDPKNLYLPIKYVLDLEGKRLRPLLVLLSFNMFSDKIENAVPFGRTQTPELWDYADGVDTMEFLLKL